MSYALLSQLKSRLGITDNDHDDYLQQLLDGVSAYIDTYTGQKFSVVPITVADEIYDVPQGTRLYLRSANIKSITAVKLGQDVDNLTTLDATDYSWSNSGRVVLGASQAGWFVNWPAAYPPLFPERDDGLDYIRVSYTYGGDSVPADIVNACLDLAAQTYVANRSQGVELERIGDYQIRYLPKTADTKVQDTLGTLDAYRMRHV